MKIHLEVPLPLRLRAILAFWLPLAATWIMISLEGPYLSAVVARLGAPVANLAASGLAFSLAWLAESPIIMLLSASTALAKDRPSFTALRRFVGLLNAGVTALMVLIVLPPVFRGLAEGLMGLPREVADLAHQATLMLLPWPAAIGFRRFYQGLLVRRGLTGRVASGTILRLAAMSLTAAGLAFGTRLPGAVIGALALSAGVVAEGAAARWMARHVVRDLLAGEPGPEPSQEELARFYFPLALTSMLSMCVAPILILFMGRGADPVPCLAAWPVVQAFVFLFRSGGVAFQEVGVALRTPEGGPSPQVRRAALLLGGAVTLLYAVIVFTPLAGLWYQRILGLEPSLLPFVLLPSRLLLLYPALEYALSWQRTRWILAGRTRVITGATALEIGVLALAMGLLVLGLGLRGTLAAAIALTLGRLSANALLLRQRKAWQGAA
ncbi:MAG TPA: hypothetical protein VK188_09805 [Holophaga sp.]|nr:hypothetical protein [Holophaga sp.]